MAGGGYFTVRYGEGSRVGITGRESGEGVGGTITGRDRQIDRHIYKVICL